MKLLIGFAVGSALFFASIIIRPRRIFEWTDERQKQAIERKIGIFRFDLRSIHLQLSGLPPYFQRGC